MSLTRDLGQRLPEQLKPKEWVSAAHIGFQQLIITFLLWAYGLLLVATVAIILLQGFHYKGFNLEGWLLKSLALATIGEIGGLLTLAIRASFK